MAGAFSALFALVTIAAGARLLAPRQGARAGATPPITILKPLKGRDEGLYECLASFCRQDYPRFQMLFAVADEGDPAVAVVRRLQRDFPALDLELVVSTRRLGLNPKIANIANAYPRVKHGLLVLSDSDIRVRPGLLRELAGRLEDPAVGLVTCFYRCATPPRLWGALEALSVNAQFMPQALAAGAFGMRFAMGAALAVRRDVFEEVGGFPALADNLADDFALGELVQAAGRRLEFSSSVVESIPDISDLPSLMRHQIRWSRTIRLCNPAGYLGSLVNHGFALLTAALLLRGFQPELALAAAAVWAAKALSTWSLQRRAGYRLPLWSLALIPLSDWVAFASWLAGVFDGRVSWRGETLDVREQGRIAPGSRRPRALAAAD